MEVLLPCVSSSLVGYQNFCGVYGSCDTLYGSDDTVYGSDDTLYGSDDTI